MNKPLLFLICICFTLVGVGQTNTSDLKLDSMIFGVYDSNNSSWTEKEATWRFSYTETGKIKEFETLEKLYDETIGLTEQFFTYNTFDLIESVETKSYDGSKTLIFYQYDSNEFISEELTQQGILQNPYVNTKKTTITNNEYGDTLNMKNYIWNAATSAWVLTKTLEREYNTNRNLMMSKIEEYNSLGVVNFGSEYTYFYDANNLTEIINRIKFSVEASYKKYSKDTFGYDDNSGILNNKASYYVSNIDTSDWELNLLTIYSINNLGKYSSFEEHRFSGNFYYGIVNKSTYDYNPQGLLTLQIDSAWIDGYGLVARYKDEYDYQGSILKEERHYNTIQNNIFEMHERFQYVVFDNETFTYPFFIAGFPILSHPKRIDEVNSCQNETGICNNRKTKYYYSEKATATNEILKDEIVISPNPSSTAFNLTVSTSAIVSVFALDGTLVESFPANVGNNVFGNGLSAGVYFVSVSTSTGTATQKVVKQ